MKVIIWFVFNFMTIDFKPQYLCFIYFNKYEPDIDIVSALSVLTVLNV